MSTPRTSSADQRMTLRFTNGARVYLYHFENGSRVATYQRADGSTRQFHSFIIRPNGYKMAPLWGAWVSCGWSYEFPIEVEGSRRYTLEPLAHIDLGRETEPDPFLDGASRLINDDSGARVGLAVPEPLDARIMRSAPSGRYRH
ncbi:MAG: hypothetical protein ACJ79S_06725 [Gemmatimonadaceae bacterium]